MPGRWRRVRVACFRCVEEWQEAVVWFYLVLGNPALATRLLAEADAVVGWSAAGFQEVDRANDYANDYEEARVEKYWRDRETAADREIDAQTSAASDTGSDSATDVVSDVPSGTVGDGAD
jgi:hypothetical protein